MEQSAAVFALGLLTLALLNARNTPPATIKTDSKCKNSRRLTTSQCYYKHRTVNIMA